jgi:hypothetical protein
MTSIPNLQPSIQYNSNDPYNSVQVAGLIRMSMAGVAPTIGLMHSGVRPIEGATAAQPNQAPGTINYAAGGVASQGPTGVSVPGTPMASPSPNAAATSGGNPGCANQSLIAAMSVGNDGPDTVIYQAAIALGSGIPSNTAGEAGSQQSVTNATGAAELDSVIFTAAPSGTITSLTLNAAWPRPTANNYILSLSTGQLIYGVTLTLNATTCTFPSTQIQGSPTVLASVAQ